MTFVIRPIITEKSMAEAEQHNIYSFGVSKAGAAVNADIVKKFVAKQYSVTVERVNLSTRLGKTKKAGTKRSAYKQSDYKVAYVKVKKGDKINDFNLNKTEKEEK
jgi:ribosomal protein L23